MTIVFYNISHTQQEIRSKPIRCFAPGFLPLPLICLLSIMSTGVCSQNSPTGNKNQNINNSPIYQVFDQEMENYQPLLKETESRKPLRSSLPSWWSSCVKKSTDSLFIFGISDPGLPDSIALAQGLQRAFLLAALSRHCKGMLLSDFYIKSKDVNTSSKFEEMYLLSASVPINPKKYRIVRSSRLKSREMVILIALPIQTDSAQAESEFKAGGYLYNYDSDLEGKKSLIRKISCGISAGANFSNFAIPDSISFYQVNKRFTGIKNLQTKYSKASNRFDYYYSPVKGSSQPVPDCRFAGSSCKSGLWIAMLNQVFEQLSFYIKTQTNQTQMVQDQTPEIRNELNREKNQVDIRFTIQELSLSENNLKVQINISHEE